MRIPDERLVYFYCSSIFTGTNAEVRKLKKVTQILLKHKASIKGFIDEFGLENISVVAKKLLKEHVFQSEYQAQLRFPDLFQRSEAGEVGGTVPDGSLRTITPEELSPRSRRPSAEQRQVILPSSFPRRDYVTQLINHSDPNAIIHGPSSDLLWRLHHIHLPFRTQHRILTFVQSTLEECCLEFGQTWAPHLMKAHKWDDAESIELTEWIKKFSKCTKDLPPSATRPIAGKSLNQVLFDTTSLRHTAVHRVPTNVEGIMGMLHAAHDFSLALKDTARAALIKMIEDQLATSINVLFQSQGLLQYKISDQREVTAKGGTELNKLEGLCTRSVRGHEMIQRTEAASAIKDIITDSQHDASLRSWIHGGANESTVSEQATPENGTLKTEHRTVGTATASPTHLLQTNHKSTTTVPYPRNVAQMAMIPEHELPRYHISPNLLSAELFTPLLSFISSTGIAMLGYGGGVFGWDREGRDDSKADGEEEGLSEDFSRFL